MTERAPRTGRLTFTSGRSNCNKEEVVLSVDCVTAIFEQARRSGTAEIAVIAQLVEKWVDANPPGSRPLKRC